MSTLLQISDTHFGTERPHVVQALLELNAKCRPDVVVLSGDITQRARRTQFAAARRFMTQLQAPHSIVLPGNHDIPLCNLFARVFTPYANFNREFGGDLNPVLDTPALLVIGVNTTRAARHTDGEVSAAQIERVAQRLQRASQQQLRIVVTHQPVLVIRDSDIKNLLHGHAAAIQAWSGAGADIVMGGHIHLPYVRPLADRFADLPRRLWAVQAGTAISCRVRSSTPNSVNVVRHELAPTNVCSVEKWDFDSATGKFIKAETHRLELDR